MDLTELRAWWLRTAAEDFDAMAPKIGEYTAADLEVMGDVMERWMGLPIGAGAEAATVWYVLGKVARAVAAYREGREPSYDTLHDISVYAAMARRIREKGSWPAIEPVDAPAAPDASPEGSPLSPAVRGTFWDTSRGSEAPGAPTDVSERTGEPC